MTSQTTFTACMHDQMLESNRDDVKLEAMRCVTVMTAKGKLSVPRTLFPHIVKNVSSKNPELKKLIYLYLTNFADQEPDLALLPVATLQKSLKSPNPLIRSSALKVLTSMRLSILSAILMATLRNSVNDLSPYVRKTVAHSIIKIYRLEPELQNDLIEYIERLFNDKNSMVLSSAVATFENVCPDKLELVHKHYRRFCFILADCNEWGQTLFINLLTRYVVKTYKKVMGGDFTDYNPSEHDPKILLRSAKPLVHSNNSAVVMAVIKLYIAIANHNEVRSTITRPLIRLLYTHREIQLIVLNMIEELTSVKNSTSKPSETESDDDDNGIESSSNDIKKDNIKSDANDFENDFDNHISYQDEVPQPAVTKDGYIPLDSENESNFYNPSYEEETKKLELFQEAESTKLLHKSSEHQEKREQPRLDEDDYNDLKSMNTENQTVEGQAKSNRNGGEDDDVGDEKEDEEEEENEGEEEEEEEEDSDGEEEEESDEEEEDSEEDDDDDEEESEEDNDLVEPYVITANDKEEEIKKAIESNFADLDMNKDCSAYREVFRPYIKSFFIKHTDSTQIRLAKLNILTNLSSSVNVTQVLRELQAYISIYVDDREFVSAVVHAIGRCAILVKEVAHICLNRLTSLLSNTNEHIVSDAIVVLRSQIINKKTVQSFENGNEVTSNKEHNSPTGQDNQTDKSDEEDVKEDDKIASTVIKQVTKLLPTVTAPKARATILWILAEFCDKNITAAKCAPNVLRLIAKSFCQEDNFVKLQCLTLASKFLLSLDKEKKAELYHKVQLMTSYIFSLAKYDINHDVRDRGRFLKKLLENEELCSTVLSSKKQQTAVDRITIETV